MTTPRKRGPKPKGEPKISPRALKLPARGRARLQAIATYLTALRDSYKQVGQQLSPDDIAAKAADVCGKVAPTTVSRLSSLDHMTRKTSGADDIILDGILYALGSSHLDMERAIAGETSSEEWELLAFYRMLDSSEARRAAIADIRLRATGRAGTLTQPRESQPRQPDPTAPLAGDSGQYPTTLAQSREQFTKPQPGSDTRPVRKAHDA